jgi:hypothetical protein
MPSIKDAVSTLLPNYVPAPRPPVESILPTFGKQSIHLRCIAPAINADPDSIRQFENGSQSPKTRILPLPVRSVNGGTTTVITNTSVTAGSSSSSSSGSSALLPLSAFLTTSLLPAGSFFAGSLNLSQSVQLVSVSANYPCEIRIYGTALAQSNDSGRPSDNPVPPEISQNIVSCVNLDTAPYTWPYQNRIAVNQDAPQSTALYITVINTDPALSEAITVTVVYVPLET